MSTRPTPRIWPLVLLSAAVAVGGAGLYAETMSVSGAGSIGAGQSYISAACDPEVGYTAGTPVWSPDHNAFVIDSVTMTGVSSACDASLITITMLYDWTDPDAGESGSDVIHIQSAVVDTGPSGTQSIDFLQDCDLDNDGQTDPGCVPTPVYVAIDDFDQLGVLIQDIPAPVDQADVPGDAGPQ